MNNSKHSRFGWILTILAVTLSVIALISLAARWFVYDIEHYREAIASQISKVLNLDISIAEINGQVDFINPVIYAQQVQLTTDKNSNRPLQVEQMEIVIDILSSALHAAPRISSVQMAGIELVISTDLENKLVRLPQIDRQWSLPERQFNPTQLLTKAISVDYFDLGFHDVLIHWDNKYDEIRQSFRVKHFIISPELHQTQLNLVTELPQTLGQNLNLTTTLDHNIINPAGEFYIRSEGLKLAGIYRLAGIQAAHDGQLQTELWGYASYRGGLESLVGTLSLNNYLTPNYSISHLSTDVHWQAEEDSRELGFANLSLQSDAAIIENADLAIFQIQDKDNYFSNLRIYADHLSPSIYNQLLSYMQTNLSIEHSSAKTVEHRQMIDLILQTSHSSDWFATPHRWPPVALPKSFADLPQPLSGQLELMLNDIRVNKDGRAVPQNLERIEVSGTYKGNAEHSEWNLAQLYIKGTDSTLSGNIIYTIKNNKDKHLQSSLQLNNLSALEVKQWIPPQTLHPELENWLNNGLRGGTIEQVELSIDGNPDFPFAQDAGLWRVQAQASDLDLLYRNKDPALKELNLDFLLENRTLKIRADNLRTMDFYSEDATVLIEDITEPYIEIYGQGRGPLADILSYVTTSGLINPDSLLISNLAADGNVNMNLKVMTPLSRAVERETYVEGYIDLDGASLKLKTSELDFKQLQGRLYFNKLGGRSDNIQALLNDTYPLTASAEANEGSTLLKLETRMPFPIDYLQTASLPANIFNSAADTWRAELLIPPLHATPPGALQLKLNSDLETLAVNAPAPLYKRAGERIDTTLIVNIKEDSKDYQLDYGNRLRLVLQMDEAETITGLLYFSPHIAYPYEADEDNSFVVRGVIPRISINEWMDWLENHQPTTAQPTRYTQDIDVLINELVWNTSTANYVSMTIKKQQDKTLVALKSDEVKGNISFPLDSDQRVYIDLEHLILNGDSLSSETRKPDPTTLPLISMKIDRLKIGDFDVENLKALFSPITNGVQITSIDFNKSTGDDKASIRAHLEGEWTQIDEQDYSNFKFLLQSDDYGQLLRNWNFYSGIRGGQGQVNGQLQWDNNPVDFEIDQLRGPVELRIKDGSVKTIEPGGVGRLFGLFNLNVLARRLTLDFKDVFDKGFEFNNLQGTLEFNEADLITQNLSISGPAMNMKISGRTGISQRDYDQTIIVVPHVGTNVALATAFLGGPLTAATVFLISKVTAMDSFVDKIITLEYTLKGSWEKPEINFISAPVAQKIDPVGTIRSSARNIRGIINKIFSGKR
ncbi:MAG: hypothetical protein GDA45_05740 [Chromatiales bacterium]|nr:hypothetical protein [Chromatiales bacterium]